MFERFYDILSAKIEKPLKDRIFLRDVLNCSELPDFFKQFIAAEIDFRVFCENQARLNNPSFDFSDPKNKEKLFEIDEFFKDNCSVPNSDFLKLIDSSINLYLNYICRPRTTLKWFVFKKRMSLQVDELLELLKYLPHYQYLTDELAFRLSDKTFVNSFEFEIIIKEIDDEYFEKLSYEEFFSSIHQLIDVFSDENGFVFVPALVVFFSDKGLQKLAYDISSKLNNSDLFFNPDDLKCIFSDFISNKDLSFDTFESNFKIEDEFVPELMEAPDSLDSELISENINFMIENELDEIIQDETEDVLVPEFEEEIAIEEDILIKTEDNELIDDISLSLMELEKEASDLDQNELEDFDLIEIEESISEELIEQPEMEEDIDLNAYGFEDEIEVNDIESIDIDEINIEQEVVLDGFEDTITEVDDTIEVTSENTEIPNLNLVNESEDEEVDFLEIHSALESQAVQALQNLLKIDPEPFNTIENMNAEDLQIPHLNDSLEIEDALSTFLNQIQDNSNESSVAENFEEITSNPIIEDNPEIEIETFDEDLNEFLNSEIEISENTLENEEFVNNIPVDLDEELEFDNLRQELDLDNQDIEVIDTGENYDENSFDELSEILEEKETGKPVVSTGVASAAELDDMFKFNSEILESKSNLQSGETLVKNNEIDNEIYLLELKKYLEE